ncbi:MAG: hypothetical protein PHR64_03025 [Candidatus Shapirobacteria bacterium]|nr:hypothetical protein [Candidatus Shapirobacteria bacterium]MDD5073941.1 hypothetical protein [Candidatus Shapirobacteria bacterium]MDD5481890.1 hypothetical protein [Candidatus Shapirobacteria bacterium]
MADLQKFLTGRPREQLEKDLQQLINDSQTDKGPYHSGGTPANVSRTYIIIQETLEQSAKEK